MSSGGCSSRAGGGGACENEKRKSVSKSILLNSSGKSDLIFMLFRGAVLTHSFRGGVKKVVF